MCNEYIVCNCSLGNKDRLIIINKAMENWMYSLGKDLCYDVVVHCAKYYWPVVSTVFGLVIFGISLTCVTTRKHGYNDYT